MKGSPQFRHGFTLVEILISLAILMLMLVILLSMTNATQHTWRYTNGKIEEFRNAREAFEAISRKLSQATLNTYWDYQYPNNDTTQSPEAYIRQSELRFISGDSATLTNQSNTVTHAVFFQAPLGYIVDATDFANLNSLLNTWGFFIEFGSDQTSCPPFIKTMANPPAERYRFRLMELMEPSESLTLYNEEAATNGGNAKYTFSDSPDSYTSWFRKPLNEKSRPVRILAENILAIVLLPHLAPGEKDDNGKAYQLKDLAPTFSYDSTVTKSDPNLNSKNQLPPIVQLTVVAVDEASYNRFQQQLGTAAPDFCSDLFKNAENYDRDMTSLQERLGQKKLNYCVFTTNVAIKTARWSRAQAN